MGITLLGTTFFAMCKSPAQNNVLKLDAVVNTVSKADEGFVYSCRDKSVKVCDPLAKRVVFNNSTEDICYAKPVIREGNVYFPKSDNSFTCVRLSDGAVLWTKELEGRCGNFDFISDSAIAVSVKDYGLHVLNALTGNVLYDLRYNYAETKLPDLSPWPVSFDEDNFYISNWQGCAISSFKKKDGTMSWQHKSSDGEIAGKSIVMGERLFVGVNKACKSGMVLLLDAASGKILEQHECSYEDKVTPVVHEQSVYFYSCDGFLNKYDDKLTRIKKINLGGNQLFLLHDDLFFSDASYHINSYAVTENKFYQIQSTEKPIAGVWENNNIAYFII